jgi:predicted nucleic acid-binding Zn ribbon protein
MLKTCPICGKEFYSRYGRDTCSGTCRIRKYRNKIPKDLNSLNN